MVMSIEVGCMTRCTGTATVRGIDGAVRVVHGCRMSGRSRDRLDQVVGCIHVTVCTVVMDQVAGSCINRNIVAQ